MPCTAGDEEAENRMLRGRNHSLSRQSRHAFSYVQARHDKGSFSNPVCWYVS